MHIGEAIRATRAIKGLTLREVGARMNSSKAALSKIELASSITFKKLVEIARALETQPSEIVKMTETPVEPETAALKLLRTLYEADGLADWTRQSGDEGISLHEQVQALLLPRSED